jgi:hypothetical protein
MLGGRGITVHAPLQAVRSASVRAAVAHFALPAIVLLAFALRCLWRWKYPIINSPDAIVYLKEADNLFSTGMLETSIYMPLYPALVHVADPNGIIALQIILSTVSVYLGYRIARDVWSTTAAGLVAALMIAVHPMLIYYATFRLTA